MLAADAHIDPFI